MNKIIYPSFVSRGTFYNLNVVINIIIQKNYNNHTIYLSVILYESIIKHSYNNITKINTQALSKR